VAPAVGLGEIKDPRGKKLIDTFSKPQPRTRARILPTDRPEEFQDFIEYCRQDVAVESKLDKILPPIPDNERKIFEYDYDINQAGIPVDTAAVDQAIAWMDEYEATLVKKATEISGVRPSQREKTLEFLKGRGYDLPNLTRETVEKLTERDDLDDDIRRLMDYRIELSRAGTKKLRTLKSCVSEDGRLRGSFMLSAASTRRWASNGVQFQNLQKPEGQTDQDVVFEALEEAPDALQLCFSSPLTALAQSIRGFFRSSTGLCVADYSSVEPRGLAWSANEQWLLDAYWQGKDVYKEMAGRVYGTPADQVDGKGRFMGKQLVLGCGYGMGPPRFIDSVARFGVFLQEDEAASAVYGYRRSVPKIIEFWYAVEKACIAAIRTGKPQYVTRYKFYTDTLANGYPMLYVDMPGGRIAYPCPSVGSEIWNGRERPTFEFYKMVKGKFIPTDTFGGSITENLIQAICRDVLRDGLVAAIEAGFAVIAHVHDEAIAEEDERHLPEFERLLSNSSPWAEGFPIATEGYHSERYKK
jgi:DNA polymerase